MGGLSTQAARARLKISPGRKRRLNRKAFKVSLKVFIAHMAIRAPDGCLEVPEDRMEPTLFRQFLRTAGRSPR